MSRGSPQRVLNACWPPQPLHQGQRLPRQSCNTSTPLFSSLRARLLNCQYPYLVIQSVFRKLRISALGDLIAITLDPTIFTSLSSSAPKPLAARETLVRELRLLRLSHQSRLRLCRDSIHQPQFPLVCPLFLEWSPTLTLTLTLFPPLRGHRDVSMTIFLMLRVSLVARSIFWPPDTGFLDCLPGTYLIPSGV